jgi:hypothetical protein
MEARFLLMQKSFTTFVQHLEYCQEAYTVHHFLKFLEANHCEELKSLGLLVQKGDFGEIMCPSCGEHFTPIRVKNNKLYTLCPMRITSAIFLKQRMCKSGFLIFKAYAPAVNKQTGNLGPSGASHGRRALAGWRVFKR